MAVCERVINPSSTAVNSNTVNNVADLTLSVLWKYKKITRENTAPPSSRITIPVCPVKNKFSTEKIKQVQNMPTSTTFSK